MRIMGGEPEDYFHRTTVGDVKGELYPKRDGEPI